MVALASEIDVNDTQKHKNERNVQNESVATTKIFRNETNHMVVHSSSFYTIFSSMKKKTQNHWNHYWLYHSVTIIIILVVFPSFTSRFCFNEILLHFVCGKRQTDKNERFFCCDIQHQMHRAMAAGPFSLYLKAFYGTVNFDNNTQQNQIIEWMKWFWYPNGITYVNENEIQKK